MGSKHDDEDEDFTPSPKDKKKTSVAVDDDEDAPKSKKGKASKEEDDDAGDVGFGDEKLMRGNRDIDKLSVEPGQWVRFAFIPGSKLKAAAVHYVEKKGYARCQSSEDHQALCCKKLGDAGMSFAGLVVHYSSASKKDGKLNPEKDIEFTINTLKMSQSAYRAITNLPDEDATPFDIDIAMTMKANKKGYEFKRMASSPRYKKDPELTAEIMEAAEKFMDGKAQAKMLGKKLSKAEMAVFCGDVDEDEGSIEDIDDV